MQLEANQTFVSIQQTQAITVSGKNRRSSIIKCKICQEAATPEKQLQCFCSCKQMNAYAHSRCLQSYLQNKINKSLEIDINTEHAVICQKCEENYKIQYNIIRKCADFKKFKKAVERKSFLFGICIFGIILSIITLAVCSSIMKKINQKGTTASIPSDESEVVICFIIFSSLLLIFFVYKIAEKFLTFRLAKVET